MKRTFAILHCQLHIATHYGNNSAIFVLYGATGLFALEVKNGARLQTEDLRGLKSFAQDYPESRRFLLYRGKDRLLIDNILCLPCEDFLRALSPGNFPA